MPDMERPCVRERCRVWNGVFDMPSFVFQKGSRVEYIFVLAWICIFKILTNIHMQVTTVLYLGGRWKRGQLWEGDFRTCLFYAFWFLTELSDSKKKGEDCLKKVCVQSVLSPSVHYRTGYQVILIHKLEKLFPSPEALFKMAVAQTWMVNGDALRGDQSTLLWPH